MPKTLILGLAVLFSAAWLLAQEQDRQNNSGQSGAAASQTVVEGCLQGSNGNFTLTDNSGTTYMLRGDASKLSAHNGHEVQITGTTSGSSAGGSTMAPSSAQGGEQPTLTVHKLKHISKTCKAPSSK